MSDREIHGRKGSGKELTSQETSPNHIRLGFTKSLTVKHGEFEYIKRIANIESDLPAGTDILSALRDMEGTLNLFLGLDTQSPQGSIQEPMRPTVDLERQGSEAEWIETITAQDGSVLGKVSLSGNALVAEVSGKVQLDPEAPPVQSFLVPRVLDAMWNRELIGSYEIQRSEDGHLTAIHVQLGEGQPDASVKTHVKELTNAITWTLRRLAEKARSSEK
jgi:hypothetical protein